MTAARPVTFGRCPSCRQQVPLIWDGTTGSHPDPENPLLDCRGSYFAPAKDET